MSLPLFTAAPNKMAAIAPKIRVIYYSTYGHIKIMCDAAVEGLKAAGANVEVFRVPETLPEDVLAKMHAAGKCRFVAEVARCPAGNVTLMGDATCT